MRIVDMKTGAMAPVFYWSASLLIAGGCRTAQAVVDRKANAGRGNRRDRDARKTCRIIEFPHHSEQMGGGRVVANEPSSTNPPWENIEPDSTPEKMRQIACRKK